MEYTVIIAIIFIMITVIGIIGNLIVLFAIAVNKSMQDSTHILIANLALADLLFLIACPPISAYVYLFMWDFSETLCYTTVSLQYLTCNVSVWTLVLLSYDRYMAVSCPTQSKYVRKGRNVFYACALLWFVPMIINLRQMKDVGVLAFENRGQTVQICVDSLTIATEESSLGDARMFYWGFNLTTYILPLTLSTICYLLLVRRIWKHKIVKSKSSQKIKRHATRMVFVVILTFGICWLPQNIRFFIRGLNYPQLCFWEHDTRLLVVIQSIAQVLGYANSCINPILYGILSERFRAELIATVDRVIRRLRGMSMPPRISSYHNTLLIPDSGFGTLKKRYSTQFSAILDHRLSSENIVVQSKKRISLPEIDVKNPYLNVVNPSGGGQPNKTTHAAAALSPPTTNAMVIYAVETEAPTMVLDDETQVILL